MKMSEKHRRMLREAIVPLDLEERRYPYRSRQIPRADTVQDIDKRYRWDLFHVANSQSVDNRTEVPQKPLIEVLYDAGYNDKHIDTALRSIVPPLAGR